MEYKIEAKGNELFDSQSGGNGKKNIDPVEIKREINQRKSQSNGNLKRYSEE